jgi:hypothetical protein
MSNSPSSPVALVRLQVEQLIRWNRGRSLVHLDVKRVCIRVAALTERCARNQVNPGSVWLWAQQFDLRPQPILNRGITFTRAGYLEGSLPDGLVANDFVSHHPWRAVDLTNLGPQNGHWLIEKRLHVRALVVRELGSIGNPNAVAAAQELQQKYSAFECKHTGVFFHNITVFHSGQLPTRRFCHEDAPTHPTIHRTTGRIIDHEVAVGAHEVRIRCRSYRKS